MASEKQRLKIRNAFLVLLSQHDWDEISLAKVADAAEVKLSELRGAFDGKVAIVEHFMRDIDASVLDEIDVDVADELPRERLMDILLSRFDALMPHKDAVRSIGKAAKSDLSIAAQLNHVALVSMTWMLNAANIETGGLKGAVKVQGVAMVYAKVLHVWLNDDESMAKTMAALDKELRKGERNMRRVERVQNMLGPLKALKSFRGGASHQAKI
ncbi:MAG: TetR/AcrR family transcriptional regulator [Hyphomicrobiales bacterium]